MKDHRPDIVLSGVNHGQNVADDVTYSGTVAAAIEATLLGIPAVAFSQSSSENDIDGVQYNWDMVQALIPDVLRKLQGFSWDKHVLLNVNFPIMPPSSDKPEIRVLPQGHYNMSEDSVIPCQDPRGRPYFWIGPPQQGDIYGGDVDVGALQNKYITITPLSLNLTHEKTLQELGNIFK